MRFKTVCRSGKELHGDVGLAELPFALSES